MHATDTVFDTAERNADVIRQPRAAAADASDLLDNVREIVESDLQPVTAEVDRAGLFPETAFRRFGAAGAFHQHVMTVDPSVGRGMQTAIDAMSVVGAECLSTSFCMWCQNTLAWYLANTSNQILKDRFLPSVAAGETLGGTGLSNPMKAFFGIEKLRLKGVRTRGGYRVSGTLPWVSNIGPETYFGTIFEVDADSRKHVMMCVDCNADGVTIAQNAKFTALDGTRTYSVRFKDHFVPDDLIFADPATDFVKKVRAGFILLQSGMAFGLIEGCIAIMRQCDKSHEHINQFLEDRPALFEDALQRLREEVAALCQDPYDPSNEYFRRVLTARLSASEWSLRASQAAMLHAGARGYLFNAPAQRRLRESYFVAIVTPATKQLRKMLSDLEG